MRLFVALELDDQAKALLADYQQRLASLDRLVRWVRPEQIHLTLKFLGEVPDDQVPQIAQALDLLAEQPPFEFVIEGIGTFGGSRAPRVIWVGLQGPNAALVNLQKACEECLGELGLAPESRAYQPHLTLGRVKEFRAGRQIAEAVAGLQSQAAGGLVQTAKHVVLFESVLRPHGSQYMAVHKLLLGKG